MTIENLNTDETQPRTSEELQRQLGERATDGIELPKPIGTVSEKQKKSVFPAVLTGEGKADLNADGTPFDPDKPFGDKQHYQ